MFLNYAKCLPQKKTAKKYKLQSKTFAILQILNVQIYTFKIHHFPVIWNLKFFLSLFFISFKFISYEIDFTTRCVQKYTYSHRE